MIRERQGKTGVVSYSVCIRKKQGEYHKTFTYREDAELYDAYKTRLLECKENFNVDIKDRVTLEALFELKAKESTDRKFLSDLKKALEKLKEGLRPHNFVH